MHRGKAGGFVVVGDGLLWWFSVVYVGFVVVYVILFAFCYGLCYLGGF